MHKIAIKELAYFICASGNLTNEYFSNKDLRMGTKCHDYLQSKYNTKTLRWWIPIVMSCLFFVSFIMRIMVIIGAN